jgi:hypothetical protein
MRKITSQIRQAFRNHEKKTIGNTRTDGQTVWLHNNAIVRRMPDGSVQASLAGWNTPTTRERVNGISGAGFYQKNFAAMLGSEEVDCNAWHSL